MKTDISHVDLLALIVSNATHLLASALATATGTIVAAQIAWTAPRARWVAAFHLLGLVVAGLSAVAPFGPPEPTRLIAAAAAVSSVVALAVFALHGRSTLASATYVLTALAALFVQMFILMVLGFTIAAHTLGVPLGRFGAAFSLALLITFAGIVAAGILGAFRLNHLRRQARAAPAYPLPPPTELRPIEFQ